MLYAIHHLKSTLLLIKPLKQTMACWSAENATKAYLSTLKMGTKTKEPDVAEFISAIAAGNNAQLMVVACSSASDSITLALVAAANQTGGTVVCVVQGMKQLEASKETLGSDGCQVEFVIGEAQELLLTQYEAADFVLIDCKLDSHEDMLRAVQVSRRGSGEVVVVGYNALFHKGSARYCGSKTQLLPIGEGLLVTKFPATAKVNNSGGVERKSRWIVKVDKYTGEEHVFRFRFPQRNRSSTIKYCHNSLNL